MKTYNIAEVKVIFAGLELSGYAEDSVIDVEQDEDDLTLKVGADGEGTRAATNNRAGRVRVRLMQSADVNAQLGAIVEADRLNRNQIHPLLVKDIRGSSLHSAEQSYIERNPNVPYAKEVGEIEWVFRTDRLVSLPGGNP